METLIFLRSFFCLHRWCYTSLECLSQALFDESYYRNLFACYLTKMVDALIIKYNNNKYDNYNCNKLIAIYTKNAESFGCMGWNIVILSFDESIGMQTNETSRHIIRYLAEHLESHNITPAQWIVLFRLSQQDHLPQSELAKKTNKDKPTLGRILDLLEHKELIQRQASKEDRRSFNILLTAQGRDLVAILVPYIENIYHKMLLGIPKEHLLIYSQVLNQISENICVDSK